jgi:alkylation response protein AidB-like acyl-CoA dehydrogenase
MQKDFSIEEYKQTFLSKNRLEELYEQRLFKLFVPKVYGGLELNLSEGVKKLTEIASIQGGMGWSLNLGAGANWFSGFFSDKAAQAIFSPREAVIAVSGFASGFFKREGEQFTINGTWSRCTGAHHATFFSLNATNENGEVKTFVIPRKQVSLADEKWQIVGLRNSSSYAIDIQYESVPSHYAFEINTIQNPHAYVVHAIPFETFARICMGASFIGIVSCLVNRCRAYPLNDAALKLIDDKLQPQLNKAEIACTDWASKIETNVEANQMTTETTQQLKSELGGNNLGLFHTVQELFLAGGLPFVEEDKLIHWAYRDVLTAVQHYMVKG